MTKTLLTLNTGSSSVKFRLFSLQDDLPVLAGGKISGIGSTPVFSTQQEFIKTKETKQLPHNISHAEAIGMILEWLNSIKDSEWKLAGIVHRIVHGGPEYTHPVRITPDIMDYLKTLCPLAPLHQSHNLAGVDIIMQEKVEVPQFACFDTAFHAQHTPLFYTLALPENIRAKGIRRYGFHGLSYDWIMSCLAKDHPRLTKARVVIAHLGNGASLCAIKDGKSIDTTMGMTALDGLPMGTRCGSIDPGVVIYMQREFGLSLDQLENILYKDSGLKGLSGITNDVKELSQSPQEEARFALDYFSLKTAQSIASMAVSIDGMDALVFTGGIGENAENIRSSILQHLSFMPGFETHVIPANEERCMALAIQEHFGKELFS